MTVEGIEISREYEREYQVAKQTQSKLLQNAMLTAIMVRPTTLGVNVIVRYITRAHERHEVRSRLFHRVVELLRSKHIASGPLEIQATKSAGKD